MPSVTQSRVAMEPLAKLCVNSGPPGLPIWISMICAAGADHEMVVVPMVTPAATGMGLGLAVRVAPLICAGPAEAAVMAPLTPLGKKPPEVALALPPYTRKSTSAGVRISVH